jgi:hypothetical protein
VPIFGLAPAPHDDEAPVLERHHEPIARAATRNEHEPTGCAERQRRDRRLGSELGLVVGVKPHAVLAVAVAIQQEVIERDPGVRTHEAEETP